MTAVVHLMGRGYRPRCGAKSSSMADQPQDVDCLRCWRIAGHHGPHDRPWRALRKRLSGEGACGPNSKWAPGCGHNSLAFRRWEPTGEWLCSHCYVRRERGALKETPR